MWQPDRAMTLGGIPVGRDVWQSLGPSETMHMHYVGTVPFEFILEV